MSDASLARHLTVILSAALIVAANPAAFAQTTKAIARVSADTVYNEGKQPVDIVAGNGVSAVAAGVNGAEFHVSGPKGESQPANAAEISNMKDVLDTVKALPGLKGPALRAATAAVTREIKADIVTKPNIQFDLNPKNKDQMLFAESKGFDDKGQTRLKVEGLQLLDPVTKVIELRGAFLPSHPDLGPVNSVGFVVNNDPVAVQWGSAPHLITMDLDTTKIQINTLGMGSAAAVIDDSGSYLNDTLNLKTPEANAISLFDLSLAVSGAQGGTPVTLADLSYFMNPNINPSQYQISDSDGNTSLLTVSAEVAEQFAMVRTDNSGNTYYGFDPGYSITFGIPVGATSNSVLFLDEDVSAATSVPEPSSLALGGIALLVALACGYFAQGARPIQG